MRYVGGKSRIARQIAEIINNFAGGGQCFVSLFCGSCVIESLVNADIKILNDKHEYLIEMYKGLQNDYKLPDNLTQEEYYYIKEHKNNDKILTGFVGFGCSFGGKWFGGYARNKGGTNYCGQSKRSVLKTMKGLTNAKFTSMDYRDVSIPENAIIYCDPAIQRHDRIYNKQGL